MEESGIDKDIERFIAGQVKSLEQLEVLLLVSGSAEKRWTSHDVYDVIKSSEPSVRERLKELAAQGLLVEIASSEGFVYRYQPRSEELHKLVEGLATAYRERRIRVVQSIYSRPPDPVQQFADAFKIRREK